MERRWPLARYGWVLLLFLFIPSMAWASGAGLSYSGRLIRPDGTPVEATNVQFRLQIRTPGSEDCLMYEESQSANLAGSSGKFSLTMNSGSGVRLDSSGYTLEEIFANRGTFNFASSSCVLSNVFVPSPASGRRLRVFFNDGTFSGWEPLPLMDVNYVPLALESNQLGGFKISQVLRVVDGSGNPATAPSLTSAQAGELTDLLDGTSSMYGKPNQLGGVNLPSLSAGQVLGWNGTSWAGVTPLTSESDPTVQTFAKSALPTCGSGQVLKSDGTSLSCVNDVAGGTPTDATTSDKGIVQIDASGGLSVSSGVLSLPDVGTAGTYTKVTVDAKGRVSAGAGLAEADVPTLSTAGKVSGSAINTGTIGGNASINTTGNVTAVNVSASNVGTRTLDIFKTDLTNKVTVSAPAGLGADYTLTLPENDGDAGQVLSTNGSGVLSWIDRLTGTVTSVSGTAPIVVGGTASAPEISVSAASTTAAGVVQLATDGESAASKAVQANDARLSNGRAPVGAASGDLADNYPNPTVARVRGFAFATTTPQDGQVYQWNNGSSHWQPVFFGIANLRTSAGAAQFGSASCGASQTLTWSAVTDAFSCTNIAIAHTAVSGLGTAATKTAGTGAGHVLELDGSGKVPGSVLGANVVLDGGNATSAAMNVGTTGAQDLNLVTSNTVRVAVSSAGNVGIGTTSPAISSTAGRTYLTIKGASASGALELSQTAADASGVPVGAVQFTDSNATGTEKRVAVIGSTTSGSVANDRGGLIYFATKADGDSLSNRMFITNDGKIILGNGGISQSITVVPNQDVSSLNPGTTSVGAGIVEGPTNSHLIFDLKNNDSADAIAFRYSSVNDGSVDRIGFVMKGNGNVGVGTTNPDYGIGYSPNARLFGVTGAGADVPTSFGVISVSNNRPTATTGDPLGAFDFISDGNTGGGARKIAARISSLLSGAGGANGFGGSLIFMTKPDNTTGTLERMRVSDNGNVGIGTTTPTAVLHLKAGTATASTAPLKFTAGTNLTTPENGSMEFDGTNYFLTAGGTRRTIATTSGGGDFSNVTSVTGSGALSILAGGTNQNLTLSGSGTGSVTTASPMTVTNSTTSTSSSTGALVVSGGLGVGGALNAAGNVATAGVFLAPLGSAGAPSYSFTGDTDTGVFSPTANTWAVSTGGAEQMRVSSAGNVGIGTTNPSAKLNVVGGATFDASAGGTNGQVLVMSSPSTAGQGGLMFSQYTTYGATTEGFKFYTTGTGTIGSGRLRLGQVVGNTPDTVSDIITFQSNGNIGVGIPTPATRVHVLGLGQSATAPTFPTGNQNGTVVIEDSSNGAGQGGMLVFAARNATGTGTAGFGAIKGSVTNGVSNGIGNLHFLTRNAATDAAFTERMTILAGGNVGIGTTVPDRKLDILESASSTTARIINTNSTGSNGLNITTQSTSSSDSGLAVFSNAGANPVLVARANGNVGIGTTAPAAKLHVEGGHILSTGNIYSGHGTSGALTLQPFTAAITDVPGSTFGAQIVGPSNGHVVVDIRGNDVGDGFYVRVPTDPTSSNVPDKTAFVVRASGNVGVGTSAPVSLLHLKNIGASGKTFSNNTGLVIENNGSQNTYFAMQVSTAGANDAFAITNAGNVGIGTSSPGSRLHVDGGTGGGGLTLAGDNAGNNAFMNLRDSGANTLWHMTMRGADHATEPNQFLVAYSPNNGVNFHRYQTFIPNEAADSTPGNVNFHGRVGIGALAPSDILDVSFSDATGDLGGLMIKNTNTGTEAWSGVTVSNHVGPMGYFWTGSSAYSTALGQNRAVIQSDYVNSDGISLQASKGTADIRFYTAGATERVRITSAGNVGIGTTNPVAKLDVAGEVKFGNTSSTCNSTNEGQQRYNSGTKKMEFCNGSVWAEIGGGGGAAAGTWCGGRNVTYGGGGFTNSTPSVSCAGTTITVSGTPSTPSVTCPTGYSGQIFLTWADSVSYYIATCIKN